MKRLVVDDALKPGTEIGPVVDERQLAKDLEYVEIGRKEGARLVHGGERLKRDTDGYYMWCSPWAMRVRWISTSRK